MISPVLTTKTLHATPVFADFGAAHRAATPPRTRSAFSLLALIAALTFPLVLPAQTAGVFGDWKEPGGSVIRVEHCGPDVCLRLIKLSPHEPHTVDGLNPDPAKQSRPLCNLNIGSNFHLTDSDSAEDGQLYDPKSGKTYKGTIRAEGDQLRLRGYIGIKAFGRTELWTRVPGGLKTPCTEAGGDTKSLVQ